MFIFNRTQLKVNRDFENMAPSIENHKQCYGRGIVIFHVPTLSEQVNGFLLASENLTMQI